MNRFLATRPAHYSQRQLTLPRPSPKMGRPRRTRTPIPPPLPVHQPPTPTPLRPARTVSPKEQAKSRIEAAGFTNVSGLMKDKDGIWRGTASKGGATSNVALDFQGNVVTK